MADFPWAPKPHADLSESPECDGSDINSDPSLIFLCGEDDDDDEQKTQIDTFKALAEDMKAKGTGGAGKMLFFYAQGSAGVTAQVRKLCSIDSMADRQNAKLLLLDISDNGAYHVSDDEKVEITTEGIKAFIAAPGPRKQMDL
jgi:hypothetical protein